MSDLVDKILAIDAALDAAGVPHAFGGALALAWCTERARGTIDIDCNVFVEPAKVLWVFDALPDGIAWDDASVTGVIRDGQVRLWWDATPVDVFLDTGPFHADVATRVRRKPLGGRDIPFLSCSDLAVFKAFFNRTKDWADLEDMAANGSLDVDRVAATLERYLGADDDRIAQLRELAPTP
ncbi:MAG TPA: hypothetical protein VII96_00335 [Acidimicrobiales bacterium]